MKISTRARYAIRLMMDLAEHFSEEKNIKLKDVAQRQDISRDYLVQLVLLLKNAHLVRSTCGKDGGHVLARPPEQIDVLEIVEAAIGPVSIIECLHNDGYCPRIVHCRARQMWLIVNEKIRETFKAITLDQISRQDCDLAGLLRSREAVACSTAGL